MQAHCNLKQNTCVQNNLAFFLLCTALWWQIKRHGGPFTSLLSALLIWEFFKFVPSLFNLYISSGQDWDRFGEKLVSVLCFFLKWSDRWGWPLPRPMPFGGIEVVKTINFQVELKTKSNSSLSARSERQEVSNEVEIFGLKWSSHITRLKIKVKFKKIFFFWATRERQIMNTRFSGR